MKRTTKPTPWHRAMRGAVVEAGIELNEQTDATLKLCSEQVEPLLDMTKLLEKAAEYEIRKHRAAGDEEGARMATITRNMAHAAISKVEGL